MQESWPFGHGSAANIPIIRSWTSDKPCFQFLSLHNLNDCPAKAKFPTFISTIFGIVWTVRVAERENYSVFLKSENIIFFSKIVLTFCEKKNVLKP